MFVNPLSVLFPGRRWLRPGMSQVIDISTRQVQYFPIPKVACSTLMAGVAEVLGIEPPADEWAPEIFQTHKWDHLYDREQVVLSKADALRKVGRWRFAFVRNPWDRLVSCYSEKIREDGDAENFVDGVSKILLSFNAFHGSMTFDDFVDAATAIPDDQADPHWRSQYTFLVDRSDRLAMDFVGRFEHLNRDIRCIAGKLGCELNLRHLLMSRRGAYSGYYNARTRERVARRYERDISMFNFTFEG